MTDETDGTTGGSGDENATSDATESADAPSDAGGTDGVEPDPDALPSAELVYPTFDFPEGAIEDDGGFDLQRDLDPDAMREWLTELSGALASHDVAVESPDGHVRLGVAPGDVAMTYEPDADHLGELEVTFTLRAKTMFVADDPEKPAVGARGGCGFVPIEMLTTDREEFRCYNWIEDPLDETRD